MGEFVDTINQRQILYVSVETALVGVGCFIIGERVSQWVHDGKGYIDGLWCMISALVVLQSFISDTLKASKDRIVGTLVASVLAGLICILVGYGYLAIFLFDCFVGLRDEHAQDARWCADCHGDRRRDHRLWFYQTRGLAAAECFDAITRPVNPNVPGWITTKPVCGLKFSIALNSAGSLANTYCASPTN